MHVLDVNEIFWMTFYTYDRIIEEWWTNWPDALALYIKLIKQTRIQQTNQPKSLDIFLEKWLWRWYKRLKNAKDVLNRLWLMDNVIVRDELGKMVWHYVRVNFLINEQKVRTQGITYNLSTTYSEPVMDSDQLSLNAHKCLNNININALNTKEENNIENQKQENSQDTNVSIPKQNSITPTLTNGDLTFENIYKLFYHKSWHKPKVNECKKVFDSLNLDKEWYEMLVKDLNLFRIEYKYWIKDQQYRPWFAKYVGWFNAEWVNEEYRLKTIIKFHMENREDIEKMKKRYKDLCDTFWKDTIDKLVKEYGRAKNKITLNIN